MSFFVRDSLVFVIREVSPPTAADLEAARRVIADHLEPTPTVTLDLHGRRVYAKLEGLQPTGAFKIRGGIAAIAAVRKSDGTSAVITSSAGNHGLGIAHASSILGVRATVVVPANASPAKVKKLKSYDIELIQHGQSYDDAQAHALELAAARSIHYISPFNDTHVIAGQATVFDEMLEQRPDVEHLAISVGGGGLISGFLMSREAHGRTDVRVTGVQPERSSAMYHVLRGTPMNEVVHYPTVADGLAGGGDEGAATNRLIEENNVPLVLISEKHIRSAVREALEYHGILLEGSASASYAAIAKNYVTDEVSQMGFVACGRNISHELILEILNEPLL